MTYQIIVNLFLLFVNYLLYIQINKLKIQLSNYDIKIFDYNIKITNLVKILYSIHKKNNELTDIKFEELEDKINSS